MAKGADLSLIFIFLNNHNCYSLIGAIYNEAYKDNPRMMKNLLDALQVNCDTYNYKKNKGSLNIMGLSRFVCHKVMDGENTRIFNEYVEKVANGEVKLV